MSTEHVAALRQAFSLASLPEQGPQRSGLFVWNLALADDDLEGWRPLECQYLLLPGGRQHLSALCAPREAAAEAACRLELTCHRSREAALDGLAERLASLQLPQPPSDGSPGERAWVGNGFVVWQHGNVVGHTARTRLSSASPLSLAQAVEGFLLRDVADAAPAPAGSAAPAVAAKTLTLGREVALPVALGDATRAGRAAARTLEDERPYPVPHAALMRSAAEERPPILRLQADGGRLMLTAEGLRFVPQQPGPIAVAALVGAVAAARAVWHARGQSGPIAAAPEEEPR